MQEKYRFIEITFPLEQSGNRSLLPFTYRLAPDHRLEEISRQSSVGSEQWAVGSRKWTGASGSAMPSVIGKRQNQATEGQNKSSDLIGRLQGGRQWPVDSWIINKGNDFPTFPPPTAYCPLSTVFEDT
jgi:hypothetical protein